ncbi:MOSC domain-containing protein [Roseicyclus persicicus]|uniref:MOSC domain-containing protein n=1 Tax=Roseicyclus persicicus TaxID=2650661 RepID=A0A7X6JZ69_9RHOB|nr:MOSC domain-containing protein [Roseibacterium persicicum]
MERMADLIARQAQDGRLDWIGLRPARLAVPVAVEAVEVTAAGLSGDHARPGPRAVTLLQAEHLVVIGAFLGRGPVAPGVLRRNLVVAGLNLSALRGRRLAVGSAVLRVTGPCAPCSRMEAALGPGGYSALRGHGGWCAEVLLPGRIARGDAVRPLSEEGGDVVAQDDFQRVEAEDHDQRRQVEPPHRR